MGLSMYPYRGTAAGGGGAASLAAGVRKADPSDKTI